MNTYRIFVAYGGNKPALCEDYAAPNLEQAVVQALRAAQDAGMRSEYIHVIAILDRKRTRGDA